MPQVPCGPFAGALRPGGRNTNPFAAFNRYSVGSSCGSAPLYGAERANGSMRMTLIRKDAILPAVLLLAFGVAAGQTEEEKAVRETFSQKIAAAKATATEDDDVALVREMLQAAGDGGTSDKLRYALAKAAMDLTLPLSGEAGVEQARRAVEIVDGIRPLPPEEKVAIYRDLAVHQLAGIKSRKPEDVLPIARAAAEAQLAYAKVLMNDSSKTREVDAALTAARGLIVAYKLNELKESLDSTAGEFAHVKARQTRLVAAEARLKAAKEEDEPNMIRAAGRGVAQVYLEFDGDLATAAKYLAGTEDPRDKQIVAAAAFLADPQKLDPATCLETADAMMKLAQPLGEAPRVKITDCAMRVCQAYLEGSPPELGAAKARLMILQMQAVLGQTPADQFRKKLEVACKGLAGKLEVLDGSRIRVTYDFSDDKQLKDWGVGQGSGWGVEKGAMVYRPDRPAPGEVVNKLRFRADRPFRASFVGRAGSELAAVVFFYVPTVRPPRYTNRFSLRDSGLSLSAFTANWSGDQVRLRDGQPFKFDVSFDGKAHATWSINAKVVRDQKYELNDPRELAAGSFMLGLRGWSPRHGFSAFGNVVIEGDVIVPEQAPATTAPAAKPPAGPPVLPPSAPAKGGQTTSSQMPGHTGQQDRNLRTGSS